MNFNFDGKVALITGGESGIGASIALSLAKLGCTIVITYFKHAELGNEVIKVANTYGKSNLMFNCDVRKEEEVKTLFENVKDKFGRVDFLINSAGVRSNDKPLLDLQFDEFKNTLETNLYGVFLCCKYFVMQFKQVQTNGRIINITSIHQDIVSAGKTDYCASKFGINGFSKALALELAEKNITVNCIAPGMILSPMNERALTDDTYRREQELRIPLKYAGLPQEIANMVVFLCSENGKYITGTSQVIDGGLSINRQKGSN